MTTLTAAEVRKLDRLVPFAGPCAFCGAKDRRHREFDAWRGMRRAGETPERIARWYERSLAAVRLVVRMTPQQYGGFLRRRRA